MFTALFYPDRDPSAAITLCNLTRAVCGQDDVALNHRRLTDYVNGYAAPFGTAVDRGNKRNVLSFSVRRSNDDSLTTPFVDAGAAMVYALNHPNTLPGTGILALQIPVAGTPVNLWLLNAALDNIEIPQFLGVAILFKYTFNGGQITAVSPF